MKTKKRLVVPIILSILCLPLAGWCLLNVFMNEFLNFFRTLSQDSKASSRMYLISLVIILGANGIMWWLVLCKKDKAVNNEEKDSN